jgi:hypothetical protein
MQNRRNLRPFHIPPGGPEEFEGTLNELEFRDIYALHGCNPNMQSFYFSLPGGKPNGGNIRLLAQPIYDVWGAIIGYIFCGCLRHPVRKYNNNTLEECP